jgi:hypothetical protein
VKLPGESARLTYDTESHVAAGDIVETATGRRYLVQTTRVVRRRAEWHNPLIPGKRWALTTVVLPADHALEADDVVHDLRWYRR